MNDHCQPVSVSRTIDAPAEKLFALLTNTANHPTIDGSSMVREAVPDVVITGVGDVFSMSMFHEEMGNYEMCNHVVEYDDSRRLVWEPVPAPRGDEMIEGAGYRWGFDLAPADADRTVVTETFDCSASPQWLKEATKGGEGWVDAMTTTLERLEALATR